MKAHAVHYLGRRVDRIHVAGLGELARWPFHGLLGAIAWRFDGARLTLVHVPSPNMRDTRPRSLKPRSTKKHVSDAALARSAT